MIIQNNNRRWQMPKRTRNAAQIQEEKARILNEALKLLETDGLGGLSMRKLASRCGFTATTIYNYFLNKDELYLTILVVGFSKLYHCLEKCVTKQTNPYDRLKASVCEYIRFGLEESGYYNIMFTYDLPKYTTYFGKREEAIALDERKWALKIFHLFSDMVNEIAALNPKLKKYNMSNFITEIWCMLHGFISLYNSHVMQTIDEDIEVIQSNLVDRIMDIFLPSH
jgi:AcrR family transcriptional regulator